MYFSNEWNVFGLRDSPEDKYEKNEQREKYCNIVHCAKHHKQLTSQIRHKTNQFQNTQQTKCTQNTQTRTTFAFTEKLLTQFENTIDYHYHHRKQIKRRKKIIRLIN